MTGNPGVVAIEALKGQVRFEVSHAGTHGGHELLRIHDIPTPPEKKWRKTVDAIVLVHQDFDRLGFDTAGFFVAPHDFHVGGTTPKNSPGVQSLGPAGQVTRLSWKPPELQNSRDLAAYVEAAYARVWVQE